MRTEPIRCVSLLIALTCFLTSVPAVASHPSFPMWSSAVVEDDTADCVVVSTPETGQVLLEIDNQCSEFLSVDGLCDPEVCTFPEPLSVENNATRQYTSLDFGLNPSEIGEGSSVTVYLSWQQDAEEGQVVLEVTFDGYSDDSHNFDAGGGGDDVGVVGDDAGVVGDDAGSTGSDAGGGTTDTGGSSGGGGSGTKSEPTACGGCATTDDRFAGGVFWLAALAGLIAFRRRRS